MIKAPEEELEDEGMTFWEHLAELRTRMLRMALATVAGAGVAWFYREEILQWLLGPFQEAWLSHFKTPAELVFTGPADLFMTYLKLAIIAGLIVALPIIFYQLWAFVAPGLYKSEKRYALPFVASSTALFVSGAYFGMRFAIPIAFAYLLGFATEASTGESPSPATTAEVSAIEGQVPPLPSASGPAPTAGAAVEIRTAAPDEQSAISRDEKVVTKPTSRVDEYIRFFSNLLPNEQSAISRDEKVRIKATIRVDEYIRFLSNMLLAFGVVFELPVVIFFLSVAGVVNHTHLIKFYRYFIVIAFAVAAVFTPPDLMSQFLLAVPMVLLYTFSIGIAYIFGKKKPKVEVPS
ncbi:MAG: Sec-independent protein translocase TatC [Pseudomonadota bacterium]|jgi:sec-independent protein translocase protein TatC